MGNDTDVGDAGLAEFIDDGGERAEGHGFVGAKKDGVAGMLLLGFDFGGKLVNVDGVAAQVDFLVLIDGDDETLFGNFANGASFGDVDFDAGLEDGSGNHENDEKDEDDIDEGDHVDVGEGSLGGLGELGHGRLPQESELQLGKSLFDLGGELNREGIEALGKVTNILEEVVVGDERGDGGEEARGCGDKGLSDAGSDSAKAGGAGSAEAREGVDDAPNGAEEADEGSDAGGGGEPSHALFDAADFVGCGQLHADSDGLKRFDFGMRIVAFAGDLGLKFPIARSVDVGEGRASGDDALRIGNTACGAKDLEELVRLPTDAAKDAEFLEDERPGDEREEEQDGENGTRYPAGLLENFKDVADENGR